MNEDLFKLLGLDKLSGQQKLNLSEDLYEVVLSKIASRLESLLTTDQIEEINQAMESSPEGSVDLIRKFVPYFSDIVNEETEQVRREVIANHSDVMKKFNF